MADGSTQASHSIILSHHSDSGYSHLNFQIAEGKSLLGTKAAASPAQAQDERWGWSIGEDSDSGPVPPAAALIGGPERLQASYLVSGTLSHDLAPCKEAPKRHELLSLRTVQADPWLLKCLFNSFLNLGTPSPELAAA
jgi:hypothetical protein